MSTVNICVSYRWKHFMEGVVRDLHQREIPWCIVRPIKFWWQRKTRGFDDSVTWSLDWEIIRWTLPRLKEFRKCVKYGYPCELSGIEEWGRILDEMIEGLQLLVDDPCYYPQKGWMEMEKAKQEIIEKSLDLFRKYFRSLWW